MTGACQHPNAADGGVCPDCGETTPLPAPTSLGTNLSDDQIDLSWKEGDGS